MNTSPSTSKFEIVTTTAGAISIRNNIVNEIMHNPIGPWAEANSLYVEQSQLKKHLSQPIAEELVLFDVGLGAAANALSALHCANSLQERRPMRMISFERDLELLQFALKNSQQFAHFQGYEPAIQNILSEGQWQSTGVVWELRTGNFLECIETEKHRPHLIFFDPYSPKQNQEMWTTACFQKIFQIGRPAEQGGTQLLTYSQATKIRCSLLCAGFFVGYGIPTGLKEATTVAATDFHALARPLGPEWLLRWRKSHARYPFDCPPDQEPLVDQQVEAAMKRQQGLLAI